MIRLSLLARGAFAATTLVSLLTAADTKTEPVRVTKANYELSMRWQAAKVGKLVFDISVTPHWLETSDRFWYSYETSAGRHYFLVDPVKKTKTLVFDNAKMAAMLTTVTRTPYDAAHLPIRGLKFVKGDTIVQFEVQVAKDADINGAQKVEGGELQTNTTTDGQQQNQDDAVDVPDEAPQQRPPGVEPPPDPNMRTLYFEYEIATGKLTLPPTFTPEPKRPLWASVSPDEKTVLFAKGENLFMMDAVSYALALKKSTDPAIKEVQITKDGEKDFSYARRIMDQGQDQQNDGRQGQQQRDRSGRVAAVQISWSQDSKKFALVRRDERKVQDLWVIHTLANPRPTLESYKYAMPGDAAIPQPHVEVFDVATLARKEINAAKFKDQSIQIFSAPLTARARETQRIENQWPTSGTDRLYFFRMSRDMHKVDVCVANPETGDVKVLIEERLNTYIETKPLRVINNGDELLWWSERDGWGHWYLYDGKGALKGQVDSGEYVAEQIEQVDEKARTMVFAAEGREADENPYYTHMYSIKLDSSGMKLLDPGNASHAGAISDNGKYFVDNASRVDTAPHSLLYDRAGAMTLDLETTDVSALSDAGFKMPETFSVKADDGVTDLMGVMYKPFDFDPNKKYPIIAFVYPGPQTESVTQTFTPRSPNVGLAQLGFIVIEVGNRGGNPHRSKWYHNFGYGNLRDYGLADKKAAIEQLARRHSFIDIDRVGIYGHSGGGFMSTAAMLVYPDFFKVAVSSSGNHENNVYNHTWSEKNHGIKEVTDKDGGVKFEFSIDKNSELAKNLKGHLLLATGDMDNNVHMANTMRMADALIKAGKRFDQFILPGSRHGYGDMTAYFFWVRADYFCRWLIGDVDHNVDMTELERPANERPRPATQQQGQQQGRRRAEDQ
jgi:dipeptidyl aminopeptidase/acylaminoacyl peptidase